MGVEELRYNFLLAEAGRSRDVEGGVEGESVPGKRSIISRNPSLLTSELVMGEDSTRTVQSVWNSMLLRLNEGGIQVLSK